MSGTKNVGQVAGVFIGTSAPSNTKLIWYDSTPNQQCHKVYDPATGMWKTLNPVIVANTTYSELVNNAKKNGLSIGKFYQITDKSNVLAIAITKTKVQYSDSLGNILVDDLGTNIQYHVSSSNLLIDDLAGVFNTSTNKLVFSFDEGIPDVDNDFLFGKKRVGTKWSLIKFKISSFLSSSTGNSISWKNGFFFNFSDSIKAILNKVGGIVGYDAYANKVEALQKNIDTVSKANQDIVRNANQSITDKTTDTEIYNKKLQNSIETSVAAGDVLKGDTLFTIVSKFQRWVNQFKYATGIRLSKSFADAKRQEYINNNDTVESAFQKIQYMLKNPTTTAQLPNGWSTDAVRDDGKPNTQPQVYTAFSQDGYPVAGDSIFYAFAKIVDYIQNVTKYSTLSTGWKEKDYSVSAPISFPVAGDSIDEAFAKTIGRLRQLGEITSKGVLRSHESVNSKNIVTDFQIDGGSLTFRDTYGNGYRAYMGYSEFSLQKSNDKVFQANNSGLYHKSNTTTFLNNGVYSSVLFENSEVYSGESAALQAISTGNARETYDAFFQRLKIGSLTYKTYFMTATSYNISNIGFVVFNAKTNGDIYLPTNPDNGRQVLIAQSSTGAINVHSSGSDRIDTVNESKDVVTINERGAVFAFIYLSGVRYDADPAGTTGLWQYAKWSRTNT